MKRFKSLFILISICMLTFFLTGCGKLARNNDKIKIVCTTFSQYDWVREIAGESIDDIELVLLGNGADLHSYQPTTGDILNIADCDVFIFVGGVSDVWVQDALKQATNPDMITINMMEVLKNNLYEEEIIDGMEEEEHHHDEAEDDLIEYDEHLWLSLRNAELMCYEIRDALVSSDEKNKSIYENNCDSYVNKLKKLDEEYIEVVSNSAYDTVLFGDRFPFIYMIKDYNLNYYAAFAGCSAESEASFETVTFLAGKLDELKLPAIIVVDGSSKDLAKTINESTKSSDYPILVMDSMQNVSMDDAKNGKTYLGTMESNLKVLKTALGY